MCRYCKNLKRLKDLDEKEYLKIINQWRERDRKARGLIYWLMLEVQEPSDRVLADVLVRKAKSFLSENFVGK